MRRVIAIAAAALLMAAMPATSNARGKMQKEDAPKAEDKVKGKAAEDAYKAALKTIPVSNEKQDPWKAMR